MLSACLGLVPFEWHWYISTLQSYICEELFKRRLWISHLHHLHSFVHIIYFIAYSLELMTYSWVLSNQLQISCDSPFAIDEAAVAHAKGVGASQRYYLPISASKKMDLSNQQTLKKLNAPLEDQPLSIRPYNPCSCDTCSIGVTETLENLKKRKRNLSVSHDVEVESPSESKRYKAWDSELIRTKVANNPDLGIQLKQAVHWKSGFDRETTYSRISDSAINFLRDKLNINGETACVDIGAGECFPLLGWKLTTGCTIAGIELQRDLWDTSIKLHRLLIGSSSSIPFFNLDFARNFDAAYRLIDEQIPRNCPFVVIFANNVLFGNFLNENIANLAYQLFHDSRRATELQKISIVTTVALKTRRKDSKEITWASQSVKQIEGQSGAHSYTDRPPIWHIHDIHRTKKAFITSS